MPESCMILDPPEDRGRRESRVPIAPMGPVQQEARGEGHRVNRNHAGFPCAVGYGLLRALTGDRALLPPSSAKVSFANLAPASGRQDHTTSPSARATHVRRTPAS